MSEILAVSVGVWLSALGWLLTPGWILILLGLLPRMFANKRAATLAQIVECVSAIQCLLALSGLMLFAMIPGLRTTTTTTTSSETFAVELVPSLDLVTLSMLSLVSFVGWVVARYSSRYLSGDSDQGNYFRWIALTIGAVCIMSTGASLLVFAAGWILASVGIHHLLMHYKDRKAAAAAAWTKFTFSRAGDLCLAMALLAAYSSYGTSQFAELGVRAHVDHPEAGLMISWMVVFAACLKSAQFPFHSWLPQTIETPTPVSALMHAGIVNAGGYLLVRMNSVLVQHSSSMVFLTLIGATTAILGSVIMATQPSIKRSLAYSTVAQMGFMILQCGLGAFSAAFVHIIAHSLYKAHAFLGSGGAVVQNSVARRQLLSERFAIPKLDRWLGPTQSWTAYALAAMLTLAGFASALWTFGIDPAAKSGGLLLSLIACLALVSGVWRALRSENHPAFLFSLIASVGLSFAYVGSFWLAEQILQPASPLSSLPLQFASLITGIAFCALFYWQSRIEIFASTATRTHEGLSRLHTHALNGFYVEAFWHRMLGLTRVRRTQTITSVR